MAYKISDAGGWGTGALGEVLNPSGQINTYANVTAISTNTVTIGTASGGIYETFAVGKEVLLHVSAITSGSDLTYLGNYMFANITAVNGSTLTLSKDASGLVASGVFANHHVQILTVAQFDILDLTSSMSPPAYSVTNKYGGILAFKCKTAFNYSGSAAINLVAKGMPIANVAYRPATEQETNANQMGWENHITSRKLYLNCPDGIVFIGAKASNGSGTLARFGGTTAGVARYPYNTTFANASSSVVKGGPTILWVSEAMTGFDLSVISKTSSNTSGRGLGRAYIATNSKIPADELLYAVDCLSNPTALSSLGIRDFGSGALGTVLTLSGQVNSYAPVTAISSDGRTLTIGTVSAGVYEQFAAGTRVIFHVSRQTSSDNSYLGKFVQATILSVSSGTVVLSTSLNSVIPNTIVSNYKCQLVTVAQFNMLAWSGNYTGAKAYDDTAGCGGILALAAKTTMDLSSGVLNMEGKGIPAGVSRPAVPWQCSGTQGDRLLLNQLTGSVILIAKKLTQDSATRIGTSSSGAVYLGTGGANNTDGVAGGAGYTGGGGGGGQGGTGGASGTSGTMFSSGTGGQGGNGGGAGATSALGVGIAGNNGTAASAIHGGAAGGNGGGAGSSILIVADEIVNFSVAAVGTGGLGGKKGVSGEDGGGGGSGGTPGSCFIYCNTITNPDYTAVLAS